MTLQVDMKNACDRDHVFGGGFSKECCPRAAHAHNCIVLPLPEVLNGSQGSDLVTPLAVVLVGALLEGIVATLRPPVREIADGNLFRSTACTSQPGTAGACSQA
jgi:hypothetical protein